MNRWATYFLLLSIFFISIFLNKELIDHRVHPKNTSSLYALVALENWQQRGLADCKYGVILTYDNPGDKFISIYPRLEDKRGNNYYVSYPPFGYLLAYLPVKLFNIAPSRTYLQVLSLIISFFSALLVYYIICFFFKKDIHHFFLPALSGFICFTFIPILVSIRYNIFLPEAVGYLFWLMAIFFSIKTQKKTFSKITTYSLSLVAFLMTYTEWMGIFFSFSFGWMLYFLEPDWKKNITLRTLIIATLLGVGLTAFQYANINGIAKMFYSFVGGICYNLIIAVKN